MNQCTKEDGRPVRRRRLLVRQLRRKEEAGDDHLRLWIRVPADVKAVLAKANKDPAEEISRVVEALWQKLTPERGPVPTATYAPEVLAFERVLRCDRETLTLNERLFRVLNEAHEEVSALEEKLEQKDLPPFLVEVVLTLAKGVFEAQTEVRKDWGIEEENDVEEGL